MEKELKAIRLQTDIVKEIKKEADKENRNFSNMVNTLLLRALKMEKV